MSEMFRRVWVAVGSGAVMKGEKDGLCLALFFSLPLALRLAAYLQGVNKVGHLQQRHRLNLVHNAVDLVAVGFTRR
jgi:hypothetical protein